MNIRLLKKQALKGLRGKWPPLVMLTTIALFVQLLGDQIVTVVGKNTLFGIFLNMVMQYFVYFAFFYAIYLGVIVTFENHRPSILKTIKLIFDYKQYRYLVMINFIQNVAMIIVITLCLLPLVGSLGWQRLFSFSLTNLDSMADFILSQNIAQPTQLMLQLSWAAIIIMIFYIIVVGFCQLLVFFSLQFANNSLTLIFYLVRFFMHGHWWQFIRLELSFAGWFILGSLTSGIAFIFVIPYEAATLLLFYQAIKEEKGDFIIKKKPKNKTNSK